ncbi:DNA/RNA non-specific endonuclease, partial [Bacteroides sp. OttesenSCG-928-N06]|nr:DNA/RNA non-specific endonuclease [Bacteroides sp. OttesenSCG-928-N06]
MCARKRTKPTKAGKKRKQKKRNKRPIISIIFLLITLISLSFLYLEYENEILEYRKRRTKNEYTQAEDLTIPHFISARREQLIKHTGFTVGYSEKHRIPYWVSYELTAEKTKGNYPRENRFVKDLHVKGASAHYSDYSNSGYNRGHMAPAGDMKWSKAAMKESFYLSNICPQHPELNHKNWKKLEERIRTWAVKDSAIIIICGPLVNNNCRKIGSNRVTVPEGFFKVVLSPFVSPPRAIGFLFKNEKSTGPLKEHAVTVDSVEIITGLDFFHQLPDSIEAIVEAYMDIGYW